MSFNKVYAVLAAALLVVWGLYVPEAGFWYHTFFPVINVGLAALVLATAFVPSLSLLRFTAAVAMAKGVTRGLTVLLVNHNTGEWALHFLFALMSFIIYRQYRKEMCAAKLANES